jgi:ferredoxin
VIDWYDFLIALADIRVVGFEGVPVSITLCSRDTDRDLKLKSFVPEGTSVGDLLRVLLPDRAVEYLDRYTCIDHPFRGRSVSVSETIDGKTPRSFIFVPKESRRFPSMAQMIGGGFTGLFDSFPTQLDTPCQKCLHCASICPSRLHPFMISALQSKERIKEAVGYHPEFCIECGLCTYVCPSGIPLLHNIIKCKKELGIGA